MTIDLCACPAPLRDTSSPTRRHWCVRCGGATPFGRRLSLEETARLVGQAHSFLDRLLPDMTYATQACYGLRSHPSEGGGPPAGGHSDPTLNGVASREAAMVFLALAAQWVKQATAWLAKADEAAGLALLRTDPHRGPADHTPAPYHDPATLYAGRPDLAQAHAAKARRADRGDL